MTMTDKQIIIDGVDVSGCCYYVDGKCTNSHMIQSNCNNVAVCYYKEYKRKEQECDMWKNLTVDNGAVALKYQQQLNKLKEENEELKKKQRCAWKSLEGTFCPEAQEQLEAYKMEADEGKEINAELKAELEAERNWHKTSDEISKANSEYTVKLRQTIAEIKKLVEKEFCRHIECCEFCANSNDCLNQKIIEKINEVEE